jgi:drug/metabolite transporter (DMT)-like permease
MTMGMVYAVAAGLGFGVFQTISRRANRDMDAASATFVVLATGTISLGAYSIITRGLPAFGGASAQTYALLALAGCMHFFLGWTFLALSQQRVGAINTGAVLGATPMAASLVAAVVLHEVLSVWSLLGLLLAGFGVVVVSMRGAGTNTERRFPWFALAAVGVWALSPLLIRWGMDGVSDPVIGVTVGLLAATSAQSVALLSSARGRRNVHTRALLWATVAGMVAALSIGSQWIAFEVLPISTAMTLMQIATPTVLVLSPLVLGAETERPTVAVALGTALIVTGSVLVVNG